MSGVVLRCPNCGTTQAARGECEACHESPVRYHCTNHKPGLWLDGPKCTGCGAGFGERAARPPPRTSPSPVSPRAPASPPPAPPAAKPGPRPAAVPAAEPPRTARMPWGARPTSRRSEERRRTEDVEIIPPADADRLGGLRDLFEAVRRSGRATAEPRDRLRSPEPTAPLPGVRLFGCLFRALLLIFVVLVLITIAVVALVGGGVMEMFGPLLFQLMREF